MRWLAGFCAVAWASVAAAALPPDTKALSGLQKVSAPFISLGAGARPMGMGEAYTAVADDATSAFWNPAGLGRVSAIQASAMHALLGDGIALSALAGAMPVGPGVAGLAVLAYGFGSYDLRNEDGLKTGSASDMDFAVAGTWAMRFPGVLSNGLYAGLSLEGVVQAMAGTQIGGSVGALAPLGDRASVGLAVLHLGPGSGGFGLPAALRAGGAYTAPVLEGLTAAGDLELGLAHQPMAVAAGVELLPYRLIAVRLGYRMVTKDQGVTGMTGLAAGLGFRYQSFGFDYAFRPIGDLATTHRLSLSYAPGHSADTGAPAEAAGTAVTPAVAATATQPAAAPASSAAETAYQASLQLYGAGNYDGAWAQAYAALQADPNHWQSWQMIGNCQYAKGDLPGALGSYRRSLELHPDNPQLRAFVESQNR